MLGSGEYKAVKGYRFECDGLGGEGIGLFGDGMGMSGRWISVCEDGSKQF